MPEQLITEHVKRANLPAGRCDSPKMVGQGTIEADIQRALASLDRSAILRKGQLGFARAGSTSNAKPEGLDIQLARPVREPARDPCY
ncbi:hypothetical protein D3C87_1894890 [compost metagenome]